MTAGIASERDYQRIERAIHYLAEHVEDQPRLSEVAQHIGVSEHHFQRLFSRWAGISPKRFVQFLTKEYAKTLLQQKSSILTVSQEAGLSSPGRLHDLLIQCEAATPGDIKRQGQGLTILYDYAQTPFGECLLAKSQHGICYLGFVTAGDRIAQLAALQHDWPKADFSLDASVIHPLVDRIFSPIQDTQAPLSLYLKGTNFQIKVWEALLRIPLGAMASYDTIANAVGKTKAARAVGTAIGRNPIAYLIPCHRVIRKIGDIGDYHWGRQRKRAILAWEASKLTLIK